MATPLPQPDPAPRRHARWIIPVVLALCLGGLALHLWMQVQTPVRLREPVIVQVRRNTTLSTVALGLQQRGLIPNARALRLFARLTHRAGKLKVGDYAVKDGMRPLEILDLLNSGRAVAFPLTIPEGKWVSEYAAYVGDRWPDAARAFSAQAAKAADYLKAAPFIENGSLEGYLFPSTYSFEAGATADGMIRAMLRGFAETIQAEYTAHPPADGRTLRQVLILASLVEAEAKVEVDRARIAGVLMNRLHRGMKLQCDATVLYAHHARLKRVLFRDLEIDSPYNTYRYAGLPPGPICSPGLASFQAALAPETHGYFYYVAKSDGSHIFSETADGHAAAIRTVRGNK
jgi:UPF0755 protein